MLTWLLAQNLEVFSGNAGWAGAGMLGAVLAWLMFVYLPSKDKQVAALIDRFIEANQRRDDRMDEQRRELMAVVEALVKGKAEQ